MSSLLDRVAVGQGVAQHAGDGARDTKTHCEEHTEGMVSFYPIRWPSLPVDSDPSTSSSLEHVARGRGVAQHAGDGARDTKTRCKEPTEGIVSFYPIWLPSVAGRFGSNHE